MNGLNNTLKLMLVVMLVVASTIAAFALGYVAGSDGKTEVVLRDADPTASTGADPTASTGTDSTGSTDSASSTGTEVPPVEVDATETPLPTTETEKDPAPTLTPTAADREDSATLSEDQALRVLQEVWDLVDAEFYGDIPSPEERVYGAIRGMLETLDDDYTSFLEPSIAAVEREDASGSFEGIGALVRINEQGVLEIVRPFEGQPADAAGLLPGDMVLAVNGESIEGYGIYEAISFIRGPEGSEVILTVQRGARSETFEVSIKRARIDIPIVESRLEEGGVGYVSLFEFSSQATEQLEDAIEELFVQGATSLILDLRDNPGGYLDQAVKVSDLFLDEGTVLIERISGGQEREFTSGDDGLAQDVPLVVLVNGGSASASEIVAGALQDRGRAMLIGETTFGKGSVQLPHRLSDNSELRVTVARWYTPDDRAIHGEGLAPEIEVASLYQEYIDVQEALDRLTDEFAMGEIDQATFDAQSSTYRQTLEELETRADEGEDPQLERALEFLQTGQ
jgi:carboxyl-terminal processing protease